jgi:hypothetical protein
MTKLSGRVTNDQGSASADAVVEIRNSAGDVVDSVRTDDDGNYTYHLSAGEWTINVWDAHGGRATAAAAMSEGEEKKMDVTLSSSPEVT